MKPKVLIIASGYFPAKEYGGPPVSLKNLIDMLHDSFDFFILTSNHEFNSSKVLDGIEDGWNKVGNATVKYVSDDKFNYKYFKEVFLSIKPNLIYLQSFFSIKIVFSSLIATKIGKAPILIAPRGELLLNALKQGRKRMKKIYIYLFKKLFSNKNIYFQSTSKEETESIKLLLGSKNIVELENISNKSQIANTSKVEKKHGVLNAVFVSRIVPKKNLLTAIKSLKIEVDGIIKFKVYGPIENNDYWIECQDEIKQLPSNISVTHEGLLNHNQVQDVFLSSDLFVFPTLSENYGHVIAEAVNALCPVITTKDTPWNDMEIYNAGWIIDGADINNLSKTIVKVLNMDSSEYSEVIENLKKYKEIKLDYSDIKKKYIESLSCICNEK